MCEFWISKLHLNWFIWRVFYLCWYLRYSPRKAHTVSSLLCLMIQIFFFFFCRGWGGMTEYRDFSELLMWHAKLLFMCHSTSTLGVRGLAFPAKCHSLFLSRDSLYAEVMCWSGGRCMFTGGYLEHTYTDNIHSTIIMMVINTEKCHIHVVFVKNRLCFFFFVAFWSACVCGRVGYEK